MKRPDVTREMVLIAARKIAKENKWDSDQADDIANVYCKHMDGYQLAKELDDRYSWDISAMDVESLDCVNSEVLAIHREECLKWEKDNDIKPPLPIGTMTTRGEITGVSTYDAATYLIREVWEKNESRRLCIKFEDAVAL